MSETSSDAESSCGWTIISNEGSDIEMLGSEAAVESGAELLERSTVEDVELLKSQATSAAFSIEERAATSLDNTLVEQTLDDTLYSTEAEDCAAGKEQVLLSSDHSDIVTLGDLKEGEQAEATASEELYLGTSCSSRYAFTASDTGVLLGRWKLPQILMNINYRLRSRLTGDPSLPVFPVQQPAVTNSSSSEDEAGQSAGTVMRRRRVRKNTANTGTEEEEVLLASHYSKSEEKEEVVKEQEQLGEQSEGGRTAPLDDRRRGRGGSILNKCILLVLIVAVSMGFGHLCATVQIQDRQKTMEKIRENELDGLRELLQRHSISFGQDSLNEQQVISLLAEVIEKIKENKELNVKQLYVQANRDDLEMLLKETTKERTRIMTQQQNLKAENVLLKSSLEREEKLQEELRNLRFKLTDLEATRAETDSLLAENQMLKDQLEKEKKLIRHFQVQREDMMAEAEILRKNLSREKKVTEELQRELVDLKNDITEDGKEGDSEVEELQLRLMEMERKLSFEQQRSDLWERLYVETKEERAKGDRESKRKKTKESVAGKVKETFDAVKNSTKEFVHHHKEQIKKAKEAVKENLRKFSDSVKSTFRHFKDSASTFINKARGFYHKKYEKKKPEESWQHRHHKPHHRQQSDFFQSNHNTRKSGEKVDENQGHNSHSMKGCMGVFDCAYQESMNLFSKATEPIRADEFYQLLQSYLHQEVDHFHHWKELEMFINNFFHNGVFIHDQMLFTDFVSGVEDFLTGMSEYRGLDDDVFGGLDDYIYRHFFGEAYERSYGPRGPFKRPDIGLKEELRAKHQRKQHRARSRAQSDCKWSKSGRHTDRHMADVKIELGPMPFDPKY